MEKITFWFVVYLLARLVAWLLLKVLLLAAQDKAEKAIAYTEKYGRTEGELRSANVLKDFESTKESAGKFYRAAVPFAAFLFYWPVGPWLFEKRMLHAYNQNGLFVKSEGANTPVNDVKIGIAIGSNYYPAKHLLGLVAALRTAPLLL